MKFWALMSVLALCQARPSDLFGGQHPSSGGPAQLYSPPNVSPPQPPFPGSPPANTYVPPQPQPQPQPQPPSQGNFFTPGQQPEQELQFGGPSDGQDGSFGQPQESYQPPQLPAPGPVSCPEGQVDRGDGTCATPQITRNLFLYRVPDEEVDQGAAAVLPDPKVHYNFVFIRTAEQGAGRVPLVAPAPQQKTLVYVLNKKQDAEAQQVIQQESKPTKPEVYFVSYNDGDNLDLPGGVDLQTALSQSLLQGEVVENPGGDVVFTPTDDLTTTGPKGYNYNSP